MKRLQTAGAGDPSTDERRNHPLFVSVGYEEEGCADAYHVRWAAG